MTRPPGGQVLWIELPSSVDSLDLYQKAIQKNISVAPGPIFSAKNNYRNFIRLNCGVLWSGEIEKALITLGQTASESRFIETRSGIYWHIIKNPNCYSYEEACHGNCDPDCGNADAAVDI
jgi:hypothetical protein